MEKDILNYSPTVMFRGTRPVCDLYTYAEIWYPTKHDSSKTTWMSFLNYELICDICSRQPTFTCMISWNNKHKILLFLVFKNVVCLFCAVNITGDIKNFVQTLNLLNETKIIEIWTKFLYLQYIIEKHKKADHQGRIQDLSGGGC